MDNAQIWRVSPHYIRVIEDDVKALVSEEMPFLSMSDKEFEAWIKANILDVDDDEGEPAKC